ncbi:type VI secretion system lipoprotein TssJ [Sandaracinus amylolyticus]|uniref:type VI secretion system lipoprotein TssJ n=1 Tax=Sandaracinus amylolyticus TaxID=927083 RepID=UPI001F339F36|nr:type VI secretion system lipoprotein TssJ [Sandaracinus amylolyticus]UJR78606.1 Type VI secretion lipoprotein/VasD [Sandaracinus amylolyticus]
MTRSAIFVLTVLALGCASTPEPRPECGDPPPIALTIEATPRMNPDAEGHALPTELRLYQVRDASALEMSSFEDVWQDAATVLGDALVSEETLTVYPDARLTRELRPSPDTQAIVAVVIVRQPAGRTWRAVVPMTRTEPAEESCPALEPGRLLLRLDDYRIEAITPRRSTQRTTTETRG